METSLIASRVEVGLVKADVTDFQRRKKRRRNRYLPPVKPRRDVQFRPSLDHRMPTLGNNAVFCLRLNQSVPGTLRTDRLADLEQRPPRHLHEIRSAISRELQLVGKELVHLERKYYGIYRTLSPHLTKYVPVIKFLMNATGVLEISSVTGLDTVLKKISENNAKFKEDESKITAFKEICNKIKQFLPERFTDTLQHCWKIFNLLDKYCISFHSPSWGVVVDTVQHYQEQILCWKDVIIKNLENVLKLSRQFRAEGVNFRSLASNVAQAGQQHHCTTLPALLIFAEACANIRSASYAMASWVKTDENYSIFLRNDVFDLESKKDESLRLLRDVRERFHSITYRLNQEEIESNKLSLEVAQLRDKEDLLLDDEQFLSNRANEMELEIGVKEARCEELKKSAPSDPVSQDMLEQLTVEARDMREDLPFVTRHLGNVSYKLGWIRSRKKVLENSTSKIKKILKDLQCVREERQKKEAEYKANEKKLELTRKIHMFKTTPGATEKLFYGLVLEPNSTKPTKRNISVDDHLSVTCDVVAANIGQDWAKLYRNLPFSPLRGQVTIEMDIQEIGRDTNRLALVDHAIRALARWRRFHTRTSVNDLLNSLRNIRRQDVLYEVDITLNPPIVTSSNEEDDKNLPVGPELVPFYRQVERYDKLMAAKRAQLPKRQTNDSQS